MFVFFIKSHESTPSPQSRVKTTGSPSELVMYCVDGFLVSLCLCGEVGVGVRKGKIKVVEKVGPDRWK